MQLILYSRVADVIGWWVLATLRLWAKREQRKSKTPPPPPNSHAPEKMDSHTTIFEQFQITGFEILKLSLNFMKHKSVIVGKFGLY